MVRLCSRVIYDWLNQVKSLSYGLMKDHLRRTSVILVATVSDGRHYATYIRSE